MKVVALLKENKLWRLANWDGCCCGNFKIRDVEIDVSCGKGRAQAVWISSNSINYEDKRLLHPIMEEVISQLLEDSGRSGDFAEYFEEWKPTARAGKRK